MTTTLSLAQVIDTRSLFMLLIAILVLGVIAYLIRASSLPEPWKTGGLLVLVVILIVVLLRSLALI